MSDPGNTAGNADRSLGQLVAVATAEMSALVHDEIALAKAEVRRDVRRGLTGSVVIIIAGVLFLFAIPVLSFAAAYGIHYLGLGLAWSFLVTGLAFMLLAGLLALLAVAKFKKVKPPEKSIASAKQTAAVLQSVKPHPRTTPVTGRREVEGGSTRAERALEAAPAQDEASAVARSSA